MFNVTEVSPTIVDIDDTLTGHRIQVAAQRAGLKPKVAILVDGEKVWPAPPSPHRLACSDCTVTVDTLEEAAEHERRMNRNRRDDEADWHGGWDVTDR